MPTARRPTTRSMHAVDPYPGRRSQAAVSSDDLLRASVDTVARTPARSPSPLFRPFTRAGWQHPPTDTGGGLAGGRARTSSGHKGSLSVGTGAGAGRGGPPPLTLEEFEALPVAIQRKYFSTLERLHFVQGSGHVDGIVQHYSAITAQNAARRRRSTVTAAASTIPTPPPPAATAAAAAAAAAAATTAATKTRRTASRSVSDTFASRLRKRSTRDLPSAAVAAPDSAFYASLPDKIKKRAFTPEEQVLLSGHQGRYHSRPRPHPLLLATTGPDITLDTPISATFSIFSDTDLDPNESLDSNSSTPATPTSTAMATPQSRAAMPAASSATNAAAVARKRTSGVPDSFYDSFRCLEDGDGLDLSLSLDDYHANLRAAARPVNTTAKSVPPPPLSPSSATSAKERRPSTAFRRHLSISKMAFHSSGNGNGNNNSAARPATTTVPSSGRSSPLALSSSSLSPAPPLPASHTGPSSSSSLVLSPSLSSLSPASSAPPTTTTTAPATATSAAPAPVSASVLAAPAVLPSSSSLLSHTRRKSRAMSLITPSSSSGGGLSSSSSSTKHAAHGSLSSAAMIDPAAAHYQDPEARLKLRVYLASPQKFDEAIQFGFPATPMTPETAAATASDPPAERTTTTTRRKRTASLSVSSLSSPTGAPRPGSPTLMASSPLARTTTASARDRPSWDGTVDKPKSYVGDDDDSAAVDDDQASTPADPDSPKTPNQDEAADAVAVVAATPTTKQAAVRPYRIPTPASAAADDSSHGPPPASSREMTLRMTLTRLDLRTAEDQMYGWQQNNHSHHHHLGHSYQHSRKLSLGGGGGIVLGGGSSAAGIRKMAGNASAASASSSSAGLSSSLPSFSPAAAAQADAAHGPTSMPTTPRVTYIGAPSGGLGGPGHERNAKESIEQVLAGIDQWGDLDQQEKGMMKRFWNRVRRV